MRRYQNLKGSLTVNSKSCLLFGSGPCGANTSIAGPCDLGRAISLPATRPIRMFLDDKGLVFEENFNGLGNAERAEEGRTEIWAYGHFIRDLTSTIPIHFTFKVKKCENTKSSNWSRTACYSVGILSSVLLGCIGPSTFGQPQILQIEIPKLSQTLLLSWHSVGFIPSGIVLTLPMPFHALSLRFDHNWWALGKEKTKTQCMYIACSN